MTPMVYQQPNTLTPGEMADFQRLAKTTWLDLAQGLLRQAYHAYRVGSMLVLVRKLDDRLEVMAIVQQGKPGAFCRDLVWSLVKLARAWNCTLIETTTTDERMSRLLELIGGRVESKTMVMEI